MSFLRHRGSDERRVGMGNNRSSKYNAIFFVWVIPGIILVVLNYLTGQIVFLHFGIALLSIGIFYYGKVKRYNRFWYVFWLALFGLYLTLGFIEILKG